MYRIDLLCCIHYLSYNVNLIGFLFYLSYRLIKLVAPFFVEKMWICIKIPLDNTRLNAYN